MTNEPLLKAYLISQHLRKELEKHDPDLTMCRRLTYSLEETCVNNLKPIDLAKPKQQIRIITTLTTTDYAVKNIEELYESLTTMQLRILLASVGGEDIITVMTSVRKHKGYETVGAEIIGKQVAQLKERELITIQDLCEDAFEAYRQTLASQRAGIQSTSKSKTKGTKSKVG
jgi:hypothetical protein